MDKEEFSHMNEVAGNERFSFGDNWYLYINEITDERIIEAEESLKISLGIDNFAGLRFLDIGSGSGLFSLAAKRMGASVTSFDFDPRSVECALALRQKYFGGLAEGWDIQEGSVLDRSYIESLGHFDIVYSWGVLHHTGQMWRALENATYPLVIGSKLFISIYNDQGRKSKMWALVKRAYLKTPKFFKNLYVLPFLIGLWGPSCLRDFVSLSPFKTWLNYKKNRGMSPYRDLVDWIGGYPFEVASPSQIFSFYKSRGLTLEVLRTCAGGHGCNEFVFIKST